MTNNYQRLNEAANIAAHKSESEAIERESWVKGGYRKHTPLREGE